MAEQGFRKWIITITVILASLLELIDSTVVNVSLTQIMGNLGATLEDVAWVVTSYAVGNVIILPLAGWLSQKFGRRNYFAFSIILFTITSLFCGNATNIWELVVFRFIQGIGGGALLSTSQSILFETFEKKEHGMATALFGLGVVIGPTIGPTLGGYITDNFSWPWIFYINLPLGIIATLLTFAYIDESPNRKKIDEVDWTGIFLLILGVGALQVVLERGESEDWFSTGYIVVLSVLAFLGLVFFVIRELTTDHPVVDLRIMKNRSYSVGLVFSFILGLGMYASVFVFPIFTQNLLGFTAAQTGLLLLPAGLVTIVVMPIVGTLLKKGFPPHILAAFGFIMFFIFTRSLSASNLSSGESDFFWPLLTRGIGLGFLFVPLTALGLSTLSPKDIPQGTGLNNMMRQLGGSFGIAIMTTFIQQRIALHRTNMLTHINPYNDATQSRLATFKQGFLAKGFTFDQAEKLAYKALDGTLTRQSVLMSYMDAFWIVGVFFVCCIPLLLLQRRKKDAPMVMDAH